MPDPNTVWRVILVGANFRGNLKRPSKSIFVVLNFVTVTSPGAWHCTSDDVIDIRARSRSLLLSHTYRDLDK